MEATPLPEGLNPTELQAAVRERYARVAARPDESSCVPGWTGIRRGTGLPGQSCWTRSRRAHSTPSPASRRRSCVPSCSPGRPSSISAVAAASTWRWLPGAVGPHGRAIGIDMVEPMVERAQDALRQLGLTWAEARVGVGRGAATT